ncbi:MAG: DUF169 domain-containing protein [Desulfovermiculus sp.]
MHSEIAAQLNLSYHPVALLWSDDKPEQAIEFKPGRWACVMFAFGQVAKKGKTAVFTRETYGCWGGGVGLGFGNRYQDFPGGEECFQYFLSSGNKNWEKGQKVGEQLQGAGSFQDEFLEGERYLQGPEQVQAYVQELPITDIPAKYVIFKPLEQVDLSKEEPQTITFLANPDQLSALVVLANHGRKGFEHVSIPFAAGCQSIGILTYAQKERPEPKAVVGLVDISARKHVRKMLQPDLLSFSVPLTMFQEMEENIPGSFLFRETWQALSRM